MKSLPEKQELTLLYYRAHCAEDENLRAERTTEELVLHGVMRVRRAQGEFEL
jgi:hypothetical protein